MDERVVGTIRARLDSIERDQGVRILFACESGSRAWGFESRDSDYDVRFLYVHRSDWYLSVDLEDQRDVIELPIEDEFDVNGWDLRKALRLLRASNPPLLEWLGSPIVYREVTRAAGRMRELAGQHHSPTACAHHYLSMARHNSRDYLQGDEVWRKKYLYVLRPLLAVRWIESGLGLVPMRLETLVQHLIDEPQLKAAIAALVDQKKLGRELDRGPRIPAISGYIESEITRLEATPIGRKPERPPMPPFNEVFRKCLQEAWAGS